MKMIFVSSPYAGDVEKNIKFAKQACHYVITTGNAFLCPHLLYPQVLDDVNPEERSLGMKMAKQLLSACDELWVFGDRISRGMFEEIEYARRYYIPLKRIISMDMLQEETVLCMEMH